MRVSVLKAFWVVSGCLSLLSVVSYGAERELKVCVRDEKGGAVTGAAVSVGDHREVSDSSGCADVSVGDVRARVQISHEGFGPATEVVGERDRLDVVLRVAAANTVVEVTAARTPLALDASASSVRTMSAQQLQEAPGFVLDDRLRQVAGFQLFRRTGSWVANPTTQGTSLRGLGSTAASRTLVLSDQVPLNDPFGGWIHWNEIPQLAMREVV